jgi:hypothetical protein
VKIKLPKLTHLSIDRCDVQFDEFEIFIKKIRSQLQVLRFTTSKDTAYLNGDRWEQLLMQYLPHLRIFEFKYENVSSDYALIQAHPLISRFTSTFWIERQWVSEFIVEIDDCGDNFITYSIHPYR